MANSFDTAYPSVDDLRSKAKKRVPAFAFEYLDGGCNEDVSIQRNTSEIRDVQLQPRYLNNYGQSSTKTKVLGMEFDAPFGIAPVGLQGLMWPNSPAILAKAAHKNNIPFILSTVTTMNIEKASELTEGNAWFQLYNPVEDAVRNDIIDRAEAAGCPVLVLLCDVPTFGYRPRDFRNGLALPPKMSARNIMQILGKPTWAFNTLKHGQPTFENLKPYTPEGLNLKQLGAFMDRTFSGKLNEEKIKPIRDRWKGKLVLKGVQSLQDTQDAIRMGFDGIIVSNHGGRQLDAAQSTINSLKEIAATYGDQIEVMMDSGLRSGPDIARAMACGAKFTFMGRSFMYGCGALGNKGGDHTIGMLKTQFKQVMDQLVCERVEDLPKHLITS
ncbi:MAG: alpha-hydroxy acid oxidase [Leeuwenhoekiella sp.]|jgi:L-lactate dehydrogenase (cytochrome)|uniref:alpha-hydroxy acid oxidase n=1 Tax=Leeuwenhoekiella TaxID=283735 RepID=UPI000C536A54|nr:MULTISPECIES: alpha-hydroxy acid oxidase [Leeuwenhoekiella]MAO44204.1 alpha-hydroxy-acid oxidizing enzyme [Leeuwenhoekiella sp.]UBZ11011.1 alpha-hydroxy-acid oxidizing protein [Leeuwenhoekiella palythoae]HBT10226.1 alpha-hydroxy-acid oxidizing enzyme [Leeuwenhoekiella sp.]HCW64710.1 alpha-hydroxy-acid oxidizing enzyme [Leeuwenhoekiella sp.]|tara:strand:+ start:93363 stop:94514 length:1152 start_codon:yes stop_codon:yes gene_type:complete